MNVSTYYSANLYSAAAAYEEELMLELEYESELTELENELASYTELANTLNEEELY